MSNAVTLSFLELLFLALAPATLAGIAGVAGAAVGPWRQATAEKQRRRADKFEEMVATVYDFDHWLDTLKSIRTFGSDAKETASPIAKLQAIAAVNFPTFNVLVSELDTAGATFQIWMLDAGMKRLEKNVDGMKEGAKEAYAPYVAKRNELLDALKVFAAREFQ